MEAMLAIIRGAGERMGAPGDAIALFSSEFFSLSDLIWEMD